MIPDQRKRLTEFPEGEDAFFIVNGRGFGVADGVGGWSLKNIDSGKFSRELMLQAKRYFEAHPKLVDPKEAMVHAEQETIQLNILGTCTMCTLCLNGNMLQSTLVGDSGFALLRRQDAKALNATTITSNSQYQPWKVVYKSQEQQHSFNMPLQIGLNSRTTTKRHAVSTSLPLFRGDLVVCGTDGLFDNVWLKEICTLLDQLPTELISDATALAQLLAHKAMNQSRQTKRRSPYSTQCAKSGYESNGGGKQDDVTALVGCIT